MVENVFYKYGGKIYYNILPEQKNQVCSKVPIKHTSKQTHISDISARSESSESTDSIGSSNSNDSSDISDSTVIV